MRHIIVDIDGTLAHIPDEQMQILKSESPNWFKFYQHDFNYEPNIHVCDLVKTILLSQFYEVFFITGRREQIRSKTALWLSKHLGLMFDQSKLFMRENNDERPDFDVKADLYLDFCADDFSKIAFVLEDRDSIVDLWRGAGVCCLQVERGDF